MIFNDVCNFNFLILHLSVNPGVVILLQKTANNELALFTKQFRNSFKFKITN